MTVVPAEIEDRAALVHQPLERHALQRQFDVERRSRLAGVVFGANLALRNGVEILGDQLCRLRGDDDSYFDGRSFRTSSSVGR